MIDLKKTLDEPIIGYFAVFILEGLNYLHKNKILHWDIKPSNILINSWGEVKISDFGESGEIKETFSYKNTLVGTLLYNSPEWITGGRYY